MKIRARLLVTASLGAAALVLSACGSDSLSARHNEIRHHPTPELATLDQRPVDMRNIDAIMWNENVRMIESDFRRAFYWDRPSHLTRQPIPH